MKKNAKLVIGFDLDGVIIDHSKNKAVIVKHLGFSLQKKELASDILGKILPREAWDKAGVFLYGHPKHSLKSPVFGGCQKYSGCLKNKTWNMF